MSRDKHESTGTWVVAAIGRQHGRPLFWHAPVTGWSRELTPLVWLNGGLHDVTALGMPYVLYETKVDALPAEVRRSAQRALTAVLAA